jgi:thioredoxin-like negative regulator of GroEL
MNPVRILFAALAASLAIPAAAATERPFDRGIFEAAQAAGHPIIVDVAAWWCPVCASQAGTLKQAFADPRYAKVIVFKINYDKQKAEWQRFGVQKQGTLIGFRGTQESGRLAFVTDKAKINALLAATAG